MKGAGEVSPLKTPKVRKATQSSLRALLSPKHPHQKKKNHSSKMQQMEENPFFKQFLQSEDDRREVSSFARVPHVL